MLGTGDLLAKLKDEGFDCNSSFLTYLLRNRIVPAPGVRVGGAFVWTPSDIAALKGELARRRRGPQKLDAKVLLDGEGEHS